MLVTNYISITDSRVNLLDLDSDDDNVPDAIEGHDANQDGVADVTVVTPADGTSTLRELTFPEHPMTTEALPTSLNRQVPNRPGGS